MKKFVVRVIRDNKVISRLIPARDEATARAYNTRDEIVSVEPYMGQRIDEDLEITIKLKKGSLAARKYK